MQSDPKCLATPRNAKDYLAKNDIPQLFECLMTGLMYHRPQNHIDYLQDCLDKIKQRGVNGVRWDMFLAARHLPLPPISPSCKEEASETSLTYKDDMVLNLSYDTILTIVLAGPGMDKHNVIYNIHKYFPRFLYIKMGSLLRERTLIEVNKGVAKWKVAASLINSGELVSDDLVLDTLIREINHERDVSGVVLEGYPRNQKQAEDFDKHIGMNRLHFVVIVDSEEDFCHQALLERPPIPNWSDNTPSAITRRLANYKAYTLPTCKYFDDNNKLKLIDGDRTKEEICKEIVKLYRNELADFEEEPGKGPVQPKGKYADVPPPGAVPVSDIVELFNIADESLRMPNLPQCPVVLILGGPGSGKTSIAIEVCSRYKDWIHMNINDVIRQRIFDKGVHTDKWECLAKLSELGEVNKDSDQLVVEHWSINPEFLKEEMQNMKSSTNGIILEGFPKDEVQLNQLNTEIGKVDLVILLDCDEYYMTTRLLERNERLKRPDDDIHNIRKRIHYYKRFALPVCRYYDERGRLNIISGDRKFPEIFTDVVNLMEAAIMKNRCYEYSPLFKEKFQS